jgi:hypothetical protein
MSVHPTPDKIIQVGLGFWGSKTLLSAIELGEFPKADVVLMGHILHDWDLPTKKMLVKKAYDAVPTGGALVVYEAIIDDDRSKNAFGLLMSLKPASTRRARSTSWAPTRWTSASSKGFVGSP